MKSLCRIFLLPLTAVLLTACQPTPSTAVIVNKGDGKLEEIIMQSPAAAGEASADVSGQNEKWREELNYPESSVKVIVDAAVERPETNVYPVIKVVPHDITLDEAKKYADVFLHGKQLYELHNERTKTEINNEIISIKAEIEKEKNNTEKSEYDREQALFGMEYDLKNLEKEYETAPYKNPKIPAAVQFKKNDNTYRSYDKSIDIEADTGKGFPACLGITVSNDGYYNVVSYYNTGTREVYNEIFDSNEAESGLNTPLKDAQNQAEELLNKLGLSDLEIISSKIAVNDNMKLYKKTADLFNPKILLNPDVKRCYTFRFGRKINGTCVYNFQSNIGFQKDDDGSSYSWRWPAEDILISVDDTGIIEFRYLCSHELKETANTNVSILGFEEIKEIFKKNITYQRIWSVNQISGIKTGSPDSEIKINRIVMSYMRVRMKENVYMLMPVWDFLGDWTTEGYTDSAGSFLTINAIDGSVIDRGLGY